MVRQRRNAGARCASAGIPTCPYHGAGSWVTHCADFRLSCAPPRKVYVLGCLVWSIPSSPFQPRRISSCRSVRTPPKKVYVCGRLKMVAGPETATVGDCGRRQKDSARSLCRATLSTLAAVQKDSARSPCRATLSALAAAPRMLALWATLSHVHTHDWGRLTRAASLLDCCFMAHVGCCAFQKAPSI